MEPGRSQKQPLHPAKVSPDRFPELQVNLEVRILTFAHNKGPRPRSPGKPRASHSAPNER